MSLIRISKDFITFKYIYFLIQFLIINKKVLNFYLEIYIINKLIYKILFSNLFFKLNRIFIIYAKLFKFYNYLEFKKKIYIIYIIINIKFLLFFKSIDLYYKNYNYIS